MKTLYTESSSLFIYLLYIRSATVTSWSFSDVTEVRVTS